MAIFGQGRGTYVPPPNLSNLVAGYNQQATEGMAKLGGMVGGAIGGGIAAAKPTKDEMSAWYESAGTQPKPGMNWGRGLKGAIEGAAEAGDEEYKREAQEFNGLQDFLEAAHGIPKNATLGRSVGELRGLARGLETKQMMDLKLREQASTEARQAALQKYEEGMVRARQQQLEAKAAEDAADQQFMDHVQMYRNAYGDEGDPIAYALANSPGISSELRNKIAAGMDPTARMNAEASAMNAETNALNAKTNAAKLAGGESDPELRNQYLKLRQSENEAMARWREKPKDDKLRTEANAATRTRQQFERDFRYKPPGAAPPSQQPSASTASRFKIISGP